MNTRFVSALVLTALVIIVTPLLFPGAMRAPLPKGRADSARVSAVPGAKPVVSSAVSAIAPAQPGTAAPAASVATHAESTVVRLPRASYIFTNVGATAVSVVLDSYPSRRPVVAASPASQMLANGDALPRYTLALGKDTISLDTVAFQLEPRAANSAAPLTYASTVQGHAVHVNYEFASEAGADYLIRANVNVDGAPAGSSVIAEFPRTIISNERDTLDDLNHLAVSYRDARGKVNSVPFGKLDSTKTVAESGPLKWVATRNKYFMVAYRSEKAPFSSIQLLGTPRTGKVASFAFASVAAPIPTNGSATFDIYAGPQDFVRLQRLGSDLEQVNPIGSWFKGIVQPLANVVMRALLWMKHTTNLNYGWVLILFGILIRVALWPLNQSAMRTSMKMQRLQPKLQEIQKKYADDQQAQQKAIMKVYADHGMSPLSPIMGCLPLLLPMPIVIALYNVFQNTIEFRGVSFLWLPDISVRDPYYITPLLMGATMFLMSWISMRSAPPNPQAKMMGYMMPVMMTAIFLNFASGLNLYYAVQNIAAIPQQWLLARERGKVDISSGPVSGSRRQAELST